MMRAAAIAFCAVLIATGVLTGVLLAERFPAAGLTAPESGIVFAHANHADLACTDCHEAILESGAAEDRNFPAMDACGSCHEVEATDKCALCHKNPDEPQASPHPERTIFFSHKNHLARGAECAGCHGGIASSTASRPEYMPTMRACFTCHDGAATSNACALCHGERLALTDIHPGDWRHRHDSHWMRRARAWTARAATKPDPSAMPATSAKIGFRCCTRPSSGSRTTAARHGGTSKRARRATNRAIPRARGADATRTPTACEARIRAFMRLILTCSARTARGTPTTAITVSGATRTRAIRDRDSAATATRTRIDRRSYHSAPRYTPQMDSDAGRADRFRLFAQLQHGAGPRYAPRRASG
ncbi:MAG: cytochrome c3 family protein [Chitinivibrionia bacterium]|nr:cytochrome c3 family protein [Chitinivibrionia bacterium]